MLLHRDLSSPRELAMYFFFFDILITDKKTVLTIAWYDMYMFSFMYKTYLFRRWDTGNNYYNVNNTHILFPYIVCIAHLHRIAIQNMFLYTQWASVICYTQQMWQYGQRASDACLLLGYGISYTVHGNSLFRNGTIIEAFSLVFRTFYVHIYIFSSILCCKHIL